MAKINLGLPDTDEIDLAEYAEKCSDILEWAETRDDFDTTFVENVLVQIEEKKFLSPKQAQAINRIQDNFGL